MPHTNNWKLGLPLTLGAALMWALLPIMLKGVLSDVSPATSAFYRFLMAGVMLLTILSLRNKENNLHKLARPRLLLATLFAGLMLAGNYLFFAWGVKYITPSASQVLIQLAPIMLLLGSILLFREPFSPRQWLGCLIFIAGLLLFFHHRVEELLHTPGEYGLGILLIVVAALVWAVYALVQKRILRHIDAQQLNLVVFFIGALSLLPFSGPLVPDISAGQWLLLVLCGANTLIAYGCFTAALHHWQATKVSATLTTVPILTLCIIPLCLQIWPGLFAPEQLGILNYSGAALVVVGSLTVVVSR
ncbi:MAG: DMT family transporter [Porticoccaceae bacterium]|nr:DMT family transporter [Porticoccaceae bacterium]